MLTFHKISGKIFSQYKERVMKKKLTNKNTKQEEKKDNDFLKNLTNKGLPTSAELTEAQAFYLRKLHENRQEENVEM